MDKQINTYHRMNTTKPVIIVNYRDYHPLKMSQDKTKQFC